MRNSFDCGANISSILFPRKSVSAEKYIKPSGGSQNLPQATIDSVCTLFENGSATYEDLKSTEIEISNMKESGNIIGVALEWIKINLAGLGIQLSLTSESSKSNLSLLPFMASSIFQDSVFLKLRIEDENPSGFKYQTLQDEKNLDKFITLVRSSFAIALKLPVENIIVGRISQGSIVTDITIHGINESNTSKNDIIEDIENSDSIKGIFGEIKIDKVNCILNLNINDFDKRGDFNFPFADGDLQKRGGGDYYQPNNNFFRKGLNMGKWINDGWLDMDGNPNEWAVAFHGLRWEPEKVVQKIIKEGFKIGHAQAYEYDSCIETGLKIGEGIYCSPKIETCAKSYTDTKIKMGNSEYGVILQCRVKPTSIRVA